MTKWAFNITKKTAGVGDTIQALMVYAKDENDNFTQIAYTEDSNKIWKDWKGTEGISPSGAYVINRYDPSLIGQGGTYFSVMDTTSNLNLKYIFHSGHYDWARDVDGNDVVVGTVEASGHGVDRLSWMDLSDGTVYYTQIPLVGMHCSGHFYGKPGWAIYNTYGTQGAALTEQVFAMELDKRKAWARITWNSSTMSPNIIEYTWSGKTGSNVRVWRIANHHIYTNTSCSGTCDYYTCGQAHGSISMSGRYYYYSGWWEACNQSPMEVYQITLPPTWYEDLNNYTPDTTPPAAPTGVTVN
jgi:hypothetical protein